MYIKYIHVMICFPYFILPKTFADFRSVTRIFLFMPHKCNVTFSRISWNHTPKFFSIFTHLREFASSCLTDTNFSLFWNFTQTLFLFPQALALIKFIVLENFEVIQSSLVDLPPFPNAPAFSELSKKLAVLKRENDTRDVRIKCMLHCEIILSLVTK